MGSQTHPVGAHIALVTLVLVALACTCGPLQQARNTAATAGAIRDTAQAAATDADTFLQTVQAGATSYGPQLDATLTAVVSTLDASGAGLPAPGIPQQAVYDGGDGLDTAMVTPIDPGQSASLRLDNTLLAHNWLLVATAGQSFSIRVEGAEGCDPVLKVIGPDGTLLAEDDDSGGGFAALVEISIPAAGLYTLRVTVNVPGAYTISVDLQ